MEIDISFVLIFVFHIILIVVNIISLYMLKIKTRQQLAEQNKKLIFVNNQGIDLLEECYVPESFFKMHDNVKGVNSYLGYKYVRYSTFIDYYM